VRRLVERLRTGIPELVLRTAFIVGHPGEREADHQELVRFVRAEEFDRVGVFAYSDEPGTRSFELEPKVPASIADRRARELGAVGLELLRRKNRALIGRELEVLVEGPSEEHELVMVGRHAGQAPEIDGSVFLSGGEARPGEVLVARIAGEADGDLLGELEGPGLVPLRRRPATARRPPP
jgi:ribosomal protein S12 methylthiotransferase